MSKPKFGNGSKVVHRAYGTGICVGWVQGKFWRVQYEGRTLPCDHLPSILFLSMSNYADYDLPPLVDMMADDFVMRGYVAMTDEKQCDCPDHEWGKYKDPAGNMIWYCDKHKVYFLVKPKSK